MNETSNWHPSEGGAPRLQSGSDAGDRHIGPYLLLQRIGAGGMGEVWLAEQTAPVRRRVAIKLVKLGMDTRQVIARFEAERQALAMMDHPHIARVLDAGATDSGRPYFVMELVRGTPITQYCDDNHLTLRERLELFTQVCQAVQHAHQKAVIHRDLKPSNVLVSTLDGRPLAKVIDFGIAKATDHRLTEKSLFTELHQMIGTPAYMSPEQAGAALDIDTRTDVYSLGVMLYELLTGTPPFEARSLHAAAYDEIRRIIREVDPPTPSTRVRWLSSDAQAEGERAGGGWECDCKSVVEGGLREGVLGGIRRGRRGTARPWPMGIRRRLWVFLCGGRWIGACVTDAGGASPTIFGGAMPQARDGPPGDSVGVFLAVSLARPYPQLS